MIHDMRPRPTKRWQVLAVLPGLAFIPALYAASFIHLLPPDAGLIASADVRSNSFVEGATSGGMTNYYWNFGPLFNWHRTVTQISTNSLDRVDYSVYRGRLQAAPARPNLSVLFFRTPSREQAESVADELNWEQRLADQLEVQREKIRGVRPATLRVPKVLRTLEEALHGAQLFTANSARYEFRGTNDGFSFVAQLPPSVPGVIETGAAESRRIRVFLEPGRGRRTSLVLEHVPLRDFPLGGGTISLRIVDMDRKFNINFAPVALEILDQALILSGLDGESAPYTRAAILDWLDADETPRERGAESDYYLSLNPPSGTKNGPIDYLSELLHIKGVTPQIFFGQLTNAEAGYVTVGLSNLFTSVSGNQININTASADVMQLIPDVDGSMAHAIITARAGPDGIEGNEDDEPFRSVGDLARVPGMTPQYAQLFSRYFGIRSAAFEVTVEVNLGKQKRQYVAWLRRVGPSNVQILKWYRTE